MIFLPLKRVANSFILKQNINKNNKVFVYAIIILNGKKYLFNIWNYHFIQNSCHLRMISIIVPIYNKQNTIKRCIDSICAQSYTDWELLLIDDGSIDNSSKIIQPYLTDTRIHYHYKTNGGVSSARNLGIKLAQGEWVIYIDADDYFLTDALQTLLEKVSKNETKICVGNFWIEKENKREVACKGKERIVKNNFRSWYFRTCFPRAGTTLYHKSILKKYLFDESLSRYEDAKSLFEILREYKITYITQCVMVYSQDDLGASKPVKDISKDYIFSMNFHNKSFWEKLVLANLFNQGLRTYPNKRKLLYSRYSLYIGLAIIEKLFQYIISIHNKCIKIFN